MDRPANGQRGLGLPSRLQGFQQLMPYRLREVLLVSSWYDSFILEEEGQVTELILKEYDRLNLRYAPRLNTTPTAGEALELLRSDRRFDLVIVTMHPGEMDPAEFARKVREATPHLPVVLLGYDNRELQELLESPDAAAFDRVFVWTGDARILLAIVKLIEDKRNVEHDTETVGVDVIIFVEDSVHFISSYLPMLYEELMKQSQRLISEGITLSHKVLRMRARPKILLATTFEDACEYYRRYRRNLLGIISDVRFRSGSEVDPVAGFEFAKRVREDNPDVPILLQSTEARNAAMADSLGVSFLHKESPQIKHELEAFMLDSFGFGPFIFRMPDGTEVGRAENLRDLRECLKTVPAESLRYHSDRNHFSAWLKARTEFRLATKLRPQRVSDYDGLEEMRQAMIEALYESRRETYRDAVAHFSPETFGSLSTFERIGGGSLGGKARGLAFLNMLLREHGVGRNLPDVNVIVPPSIVIGTELFDEFMESNNLAEIALSEAPDETIREAFLEAKLPGPLVKSLQALIQLVRVPFAVRSSSLLEDSQHQPFAGVYETYMLPNCSDHDKHRLRELSTAIKLVYASTFSARAKTYLKATPQRPEKEKMAVIIQHLIGRPHSGRFYPCFSGVAQSYNYYPFGRITSQDGAARVALGLGMTVVEGRGGVRFCPKYPRHLPQFSSVDDILKNSQKTFAALPLGEMDGDPHRRFRPRLFPVKQAQLDGTLDPVGSVYSHENHTIHDGMARPGTPIITFAGILKHGLFPLPELLCELLEIGTKAMITPIELEFAVDLERPENQPPTFACLQMRPLAVMRELTRLDLKKIDGQHLLCQSPRAMGNGRIKGIQDVVCIVPELFDRKDSRRTAAAVADLNAFLRMEKRPYLLIGPGRWGSADPWLGIPVNWGQIAGARIIVETGFSGLSVTPSEGSHFFHNMTAFHVGYMTVNPDSGEGMIDWDWLLSQQVLRSGTNGLRWIRLPEPLIALINGQSCEGVIVKSERQAQPGEPPA